MPPFGASIKASPMLSVQHSKWINMQLQNFMHYTDVGCRIVGMQCFEWIGRKGSREEQTPLQRLWFLFSALNMIYQMLGMILYLFLVDWLEEQQGGIVGQISETCSVMGIILFGISNMWMLLHHRSDIESILAELQELYPRQTGQYRIDYNYEKSTRQMKHIAIYFTFAWSYYNALPIIELVYELLLESQHFRYNYQSNTWYPWQLLTNPDSIVSFVAAYLCQVVASIMGVVFMTISQFLLCVFVTQLQLHFDGLASGLGSLDASQPGANDQLKSLIAYHIRLLSITRKVNGTFNSAILINFATSTIAICLMAYSMVMFTLFMACKYSVGLLAFLILTFFICYNGDQLTSASNELLPAAFYNNWYEGDLTYKKMMFFFIMRSCETQELRAYKFMSVSMITYMAILKFSYQLFMFLRTMA